MKITMENGFTFEGTQAEYEAFMAFAERKESEQSSDTIEFEGEQYRKVNRKAQAGDVVVLTGDELPKWFTKGKAYEINAEGEIGTCDYGDHNYDVYSEKYGRTTETVDVYEKALADVSKPKLKAGDYVAFEKDGLDITAGKAYKIEGVSSNGKYYVIDDAGIKDYRVNNGCKYEILSAEEVAKHRESEKWAKIGRKVGEYKVGDIIEYGAFGEFKTPPRFRKVAKVDGNKIRFYDNSFGNETEFMPADSTSIRLIAPVESTLN